MSPLPRLLLLYLPCGGWLALGVLLALVGLLANVTLMGVSGWFITAMGVAGATGVPLNYFTPAALIRAMAILRSGGRYAERLVTHEATFRLISRLRVWLFQRVEPLPPGVLGAYHGGDIEGRLGRDVNRLETVYLRFFVPVLVAALATPAILIWLDRVAPSFALAVGVPLVLSGLLVPWLLARLSAREGRFHIRLSSALAEAAVDAVQGMSELLAFGRAGSHALAFAASSRTLTDAQTRMGRLLGLSEAALLAGSNLALWCVVALGVPLLRQGRLTGPDLVMAALAALAAFEALSPLPGAFLGLAGVLESAKRIFALADARPPERKREEDLPLPERCDIHLKAVTFSYPGGNGIPALDGFDMNLPQGRRVAVVGPTGAGKSTLTLLLTGLLAPGSGQITLNGRPLDDFAPETLRACFTVAPQDPSLFSGTIAENLRLGRPNATETELRKALETVRLEEFVDSLPHGLDTFLGEAGLTLSGGEAKRLSIARALVKKASILILDEPGEGLDYRTERQMLENVRKALAGRTLLLITHRAAGLDWMDEIVRLEPR